MTLTLTAASGIKINRYPKIKFNVPAREGLVSGGESTLGNDSPPPIDAGTGANYFDDTVDPLRLVLDLDAQAPRGRHDLEGQVKYYYCVVKSGFCAPAKASVKIPLTVR